MEPDRSQLELCEEFSELILSPPRRKANVNQRKETWSIYVYHVLRQVNQDLTISVKGMALMNNILFEIFERIASEASQLLRRSQKSTLSHCEIQTAVRLLFPRRLSTSAVAAGNRAIQQIRDAKHDEHSEQSDPDFD
ncbi:hypothetical protein P9112_001798 [Eukaryota sp. TZLM1-RC]